MKHLLPSLRACLVLTVVTGLAYPLAVWAFAILIFPAQAGGSLVRRDDRVVGSVLLAQKTAGPGYVHPRPSACDYATVPSGASNAGWTDAALLTRLRTHSAEGEDPGQSGSGLDPDITPESALRQLSRVAAVRHWSEPTRLLAAEWVAAHTRGGIISPPTVNVLELNLLIDSLERRP